MTRINAGIHPYELHGKQLLAEHREITRIPNNVLKGKANLNNIPKTFTLGKGHVTFFYNKLPYLKERYTQIHQELKRRGYNITDKTNAFHNLPTTITIKGKTHQINIDYTPTQEDRQLVIDRIHSKNKQLHTTPPPPLTKPSPRPKKPRKISKNPQDTITST